MAWTIPDLETLISAIETVISGRISSDVESYQIAGRSITKIPITELIPLRKELKRELSNLQATARIDDGLDSKRKIKVRFTAY